MTALIDQHRGRFGVEPICETLGVSASAYYQRASGRRSARALEDQRLLELIRTTHEANYAPMGTGGCGRRWAGPVSRSLAARCTADSGLFDQFTSHLDAIAQHASDPITINPDAADPNPVVPEPDRQDP